MVQQHAQRELFRLRVLYWKCHRASCRVSNTKGCAGEELSPVHLTKPLLVELGVVRSEPRHHVVCSLRFAHTVDTLMLVEKEVELGLRRVFRHGFFLPHFPAVVVQSKGLRVCLGFVKLDLRLEHPGFFPFSHLRNRYPRGDLDVLHVGTQATRLKVEIDSYHYSPLSLITREGAWPGLAFSTLLDGSEKPPHCQDDVSHAPTSLLRHLQPHRYRTILERLLYKRQRHLGDVGNRQALNLLREENV